MADTAAETGFEQELTPDQRAEVFPLILRVMFESKINRVSARQLATLLPSSLAGIVAQAAMEMAQERLIRAERTEDPDGPVWLLTGYGQEACQLVMDIAKAQDSDGSRETRLNELFGMPPLTHGHVTNEDLGLGDELKPNLLVEAAQKWPGPEKMQKALALLREKGLMAPEGAGTETVLQSLQRAQAGIVEDLTDDGADRSYANLRDGWLALAASCEVLDSFEREPGGYAHRIDLPYREVARWYHELAGASSHPTKECTIEELRERMAREFENAAQRHQLAALASPVVAEHGTAGVLEQMADWLSGDYVDAGEHVAPPFTHQELRAAAAAAKETER